MHPQTIKPPPPCLIVGLTFRSSRSLTSLNQPHDLPSELNRFIFDSSENITRFQSSSAQFLCSLAHSSLALIFFLLSEVFFFFSPALRPQLLSALATVLLSTWILWTS